MRVCARLVSFLFRGYVRTVGSVADCLCCRCCCASVSCELREKGNGGHACQLGWSFASALLRVYVEERRRVSSRRFVAPHRDRFCRRVSNIGTEGGRRGGEGGAQYSSDLRGTTRAPALPGVSLCRPLSPWVLRHMLLETSQTVHTRDVSIFVLRQD